MKDSDSAFIEVAQIEYDSFYACKKEISPTRGKWSYLENEAYRECFVIERNFATERRILELCPDDDDDDTKCRALASALY